jgi:fatty-acid desaturase
MSWDNIHIDHIKPCASFDLTDPNEQRKCFHWSNMQPLLAKDNRMKSDKRDKKLEIKMLERAIEFLELIEKLNEVFAAKRTLRDKVDKLAAMLTKDD